jgi:uncharacterized protein YecE (DUF72 family)
MKKTDKLHIGTSGWHYKSWKGKFYPENIDDKQLLMYYQKYFNTTEINNTFYKIPSKDTLESWYNMVNNNFIYTVKASRYITHMKKLKDSKEPVENFINPLQSLGDKLCVILFQLPPRWKFNKDRLNYFLNILPKDYRYSFEFRDKDWFNNETYNILNDHNASFCIYDLEGETSPIEITSDFVYCRFHGPNRKYEGEYGKHKLKIWVDRIKNWLGKGKEVFIYFNNDKNCEAPKDANRLIELIN